MKILASLMSAHLKDVFYLVIDKSFKDALNLLLIILNLNFVPGLKMESGKTLPLNVKLVTLKEF